MDPNQAQNYTPTPEDQKIQREYVISVWKDKIYQFFYNIWPSVNRVLSFFLYHLLRVVKGFFKVAMEQFKQGV